MTMVDGAAKTERQPTTGQWQKPRRCNERATGGPGGIALAGAGLLATLVVVLLLWWAAARQPQVEVPNVVGMSRVKAEALLNGMGLKVRGTHDQVGAQPPGTVLRTDPSAGQKLGQGAGVSLTLASASPAVKPSGSVQTPPVAESPAAAEGPATQQPAPVVAPPAAVVPAPVVVAPPVVVPAPVVVSPPVVVPPPVVQPPPAPALRPVPDVVGFDQSRAGRVLAQDGLGIGSVIEQESNQQPGAVLRTDPRAGTTVAPGSTVDLVVARPRQIAVPSVVGLDKASAERVLVKDGLRVGSVTEQESTQKAGTVLRTDPRAGTTVAPGSTVNLVVAKPPATNKPPATKSHP